MRCEDLEQAEGPGDVFPGPRVRAWSLCRTGLVKYEHLGHQAPRVNTFCRTHQQGGSSSCAAGGSAAATEYQEQDDQDDDEPTDADVHGRSRLQSVRRATLVLSVPARRTGQAPNRH